MNLEVNVGEPGNVGWWEEVVSVADSMGKVRLRKLLGSMSITWLSGLVKTLVKIATHWQAFLRLFLPGRGYQ